MYNELASNFTLLFLLVGLCFFRGRRKNLFRKKKFEGFFIQLSMVIEARRKSFFCLKKWVSLFEFEEVLIVFIIPPTKIDPFKILIVQSHFNSEEYLRAFRKNNNRKLQKAWGKNHTLETSKKRQLTIVKEFSLLLHNAAAMHTLFHCNCLMKQSRSSEVSIRLTSIRV